MAWQQVGELLKTGKYKELKQMCENDLVKKGFVETKNFGWVKLEDYDRFDFLRRDIGIPTIQEDGKDEKTKKPIKITIVSPIYRNWQNLVEMRSKATYAQQQAINELVSLGL